MSSYRDFIDLTDSPDKRKKPILIQISDDESEISEGEIKGSDEDSIIEVSSSDYSVKHIRRKSYDSSSIHSQQIKRGWKRSRKSPSPSLREKYRKTAERDRRVFDRKRDTDEEEDIKPKIDEPDTLFGLFFCEVCNIKMNSQTIYLSHMNGKRHLKAVKAKNIPYIIMETIPGIEEPSRYPPPAPGVYRLKSRERAFLQDIVEKQVKTPCPGLHKVTEIRGFVETTYYCELCDVNCPAISIIPHLGGFRHQVKCLRYFDPDLYQAVKDEPKFKIDKFIRSKLRIIERKRGLGQIVVEKEYFGAATSHSREKKRSMHEPSTSLERHSAYYDETTQPDKSKSGYYCNICESSMNCLEMWKNHIIGKRHLANKKRAPGSIPSKLKYVRVANARAVLLEKLRGIEEPVVGLDQIRENQNVENNFEMYNCMLCAACFTQVDIVEHVLSQKHRRKYLQHIQHPELELLEEMNLPERDFDSLMIEICEKCEQERGRGQPDVFISRNLFKN